MVGRDVRHHRTTMLWIVLLAHCVMVSCSRTKYRLQADREAYGTIAERNSDPRWSAANYSIEMDARSRYHTPHNPDCPPMPLDDPAAHQYMQCVAGKKGWSHWYDNGIDGELENPLWQSQLRDYVALTDEGKVKLDVDAAIRLAYLHSPNHQNQLETLYLSSLDVTEERFRLDTQFFGGYNLNYLHQGPLIPARLAYNETLGRFVVTPSIDGVESNLHTVGRPSIGNPAFEVRRRFATAGELLFGFANSFVFEFTGGDANLSASLANLAFIQPLLRGAGRDVALEQLTRTERILLANLRAYAQFRQGLYTQVTIGELGVNGPNRFGGGTQLQSFSGQGSTAGYLGLLQQLQRIRNTQDNLNLQLRTLEQLEVRLAFGSIDLVQVDQFRQSVERERTNLLRSQNSYELALENFKTDTLGLPPDLPIELDDSLLQQFQLVSPDATRLLDQIVELQTRIGALPVDDQGNLVEIADATSINQLMAEVLAIVGPVKAQLNSVPNDLANLQEVAPRREEQMTEVEQRLFRRDLAQLNKKLDDLQLEFQPIPVALAQLEREAKQVPLGDTVDGLIDRLRTLRRLVERSVLVQAGARLETVTVGRLDLDYGEALRLALTNRLDFMNGRSALVDSWRLIQVNADALQGILNITADADVRTAKNNPVSFRAPTGSARLGLEFDAPLTRLLERNDYRESLINYQRSRRALVRSRDTLNKGLRALLRQVELLRRDLEIQRRAVTIAIRQVDVTQADLDAPVRPAQPGQRPNQFGPTAAINLLTAAEALRDTQNRFLSVWLDYYATRLRLEREMGTMALDTEGNWIEVPPEQADNSASANDDGLEPNELPPPLPQAWIKMLDRLPEALPQPADEGNEADAWQSNAPHVPEGNLGHLAPATPPLRR